MEADELRDRIAAFPRWQYRFEFANGVTTPMPDPSMINRQEQRRRYFFEPLLSLTGGSLGGHRVLDLGCNAGFWSLHAIEAGADFVLGIDVRQAYIDQANLVFETKGIDRARYQFDRHDLFDFAFRESFDVVLCLGLMEHVAKPVELFDLIARVGAEIVVVDTEVSRSRASLFEVDSLHDGEGVGDNQLVLLPTRRALIELASEFGFATVPLEPNIDDYAGMSDYHRQRRLAFICAKQASLDGLPREKRQPIMPWWATSLGARRS
jgi:tRNA (mo5U34)-methyltransferase